MDTIPTLVGSRVRLRPLQAQDANSLLDAASDGRLWELEYTVVPSAETVESYIATALRGRDAGTVLPFVIEDLQSGRVAGSTRMWNIDPPHRRLEIGHTWLALSLQRSHVNTEAKFLLLRHAFETMGCIRVQFTTDEINARSRAAIERLGAVQEGILRNERIMPSGRRRNSVVFSITDAEWPRVRESLLRRMAAHGVAGVFSAP
ncbi:MAG: GNAT family N-acetyltransferase [Betaproteobacteria bacterium]|nr:GNAT family N-acetyltransferase [Betaproteobacteria bacterium]MBU6510794.1 GNAT family N-acetyltransferase [Betaproteobacteria bacterium]MDE2150917.1 GNAT family N-acetyltransferase [Betaproteobacteria bacterium]